MGDDVTSLQTLHLSSPEHVLNTLQSSVYPKVFPEILQKISWQLSLFVTVNISLITFPRMTLIPFAFLPRSSAPSYSLLLTSSTHTIPPTSSSHAPPPLPVRYRASFSSLHPIAPFPSFLHMCPRVALPAVCL
ncbi:hypothetical protein E2C01_069640 [Portunus trituberculatus]|uniref:Uncharacterized protein n=1 Tax=Portunus trituberculatus TaxID=210409 RepID=A0A5B7HZX7_PORTR|nr:hypothetical protein [Portunus trituberculatus]